MKYWVVELPGHGSVPTQYAHYRHECLSLHIVLWAMVDIHKATKFVRKEDAEHMLDGLSLEGVRAAVATEHEDVENGHS